MSQWTLLTSIDSFLRQGASWIAVVASGGFLLGTVLIASYRASTPIVSLTPADLFDQEKMMGACLQLRRGVTTRMTKDRWFSMH